MAAYAYKQIVLNEHVTIFSPNQAYSERDLVRLVRPTKRLSWFKQVISGSIFFEVEHCYLVITSTFRFESQILLKFVQGISCSWLLS